MTKNAIRFAASGLKNFPPIWILFILSVLSILLQECPEGLHPAARQSMQGMLDDLIVLNACLILITLTMLQDNSPISKLLGPNFTHGTGQNWKMHALKQIKIVAK